MRLFGADLHLIQSQDGKLTPDLFQAMIGTAARMGREPNSYYTDQFNNKDAIQGYMALGNELLEQVGCIDAFCAGVGTAGMIVGVSRALRQAGSKTRIVALEPASSPVITTGKGGPHRVEGIAAGFVPPHLKPEEYDEARAIPEEAAREMSRRLAKTEGIFAGVSTGLNVVAALQLAKELGRGKTVVTVAVDSGMKYLAGALFQE
jgi:cysteine synthase A